MSPTSTPFTLRGHVLYLGNGGDGAVQTEKGIFFTPYTLPTEDVIISPTSEPHKATLIEIIKPSQDRVTPPCKHFGLCGGCSTQILSLNEGLKWKKSIINNKLSQFSHTPLKIRSFQVPLYARRRMDIAVKRISSSVHLGLHTKKGKQIIDIEECYVLKPELFTLLYPLRKILTSLSSLKKQGSLVANLTHSGVDLLIKTEQALSQQDCARLIKFAQERNIPRISWMKEGLYDIPETIIQLKPITHQWDDVIISPAAGAFLQATEESEHHITSAVALLLSQLKKTKKIIELFAGCGTLSFPLSKYGSVSAYESDRLAYTCLKNAAQIHKKPIIAHHRNLERQPLMGNEIEKSADVIILDPPYKGAAPQINQIAKTGKPVIYVSCNPNSLQKDAGLLNAAGYQISDVTLIDQFLWSTEIETVCLFSKKQ